MKKGFLLIIVLILGGLYTLWGQEILTAGRYLEQVSERYSNIRTYVGRLSIQSGGTQMYGVVYAMMPNFLRIDFSSPAEQVILYNGESLMIYLPGERAILNQAVANQGGGANIATARGLNLLRRNYVPAFVVGPAPVPLDPGSGEMVIKLKLVRRSNGEGFTEIILDISPDTQLIRRITGRTITDATVRFDFSGVSLNTGIPERLFVFESPPASNMYNNFLLRGTD
ncbi:MAG: outer membrane lipoprotein carrier protein LolA [Spirochaetaceae bacterium]|jgi:outer membrane lipoprotein-sorting protein|nr:outer membrane lipoprotein carrier protein LolA [Spirochaetaceae bacterium]